VAELRRHSTYIKGKKGEKKEAKKRRENKRRKCLEVL